MFYRVEANINFRSEDEANDFYHDCELALAKGNVINPGTQEQECCHIQLHRCAHDEQPHGSCTEVDWQDNCPPPPVP